jgi:hypothetical protein
LGAVSLGFTPDGKRIRRKVSGKTKQEVRDKLKALHQELDAGVRSPAGYTVRRAVEDWLGEGLDGRSERTTTLYAGLLQPVLEIIGAKPLRDLTAGDVRSALGQLTSRYSTRSLQITRNSLDRAIRHAQANDLVARNVAALVVELKRLLRRLDQDEEEVVDLPDRVGEPVGVERFDDVGVGVQFVAAHDVGLGL